MYRKYPNSGKSTRNERLAQLSEQENVIEKKKKEILAKLEAQKKKETEEAYKKLEPQSSSVNDRRDSSKEISSIREKHDDSEKAINKCPRNAFSNDGSFLDQFKKMSESRLDPKCFSFTTKKEKEELNKDDSVNSAKHKGENKDQCSKIHLDSDIQLQLPAVGIVQAVLHKDQKPLVPCSVNENTVSHSAQSKIISSTPLLEISHTSYQSHLKTHESLSKDYSYPTDFNKSHDILLPVPSPSPSAPIKQESSFETDVSTRISPALPDERAIRNECTLWAESALRKDINLHYGFQNAEIMPYHEKRVISEGCGILADSENFTKSYFDSKSENISGKRRKKISDSSNPDTNSKETLQKIIDFQHRDGYQADCEAESSCQQLFEDRQKKYSFRRTSLEVTAKPKECESDQGDEAGEKRKKKKKSRWGDEIVPTGTNSDIQLPPNVLPLMSTSIGKSPMLSKLTRSDPGLLQYARQTFGSTNLSEEDWKKAEDHYKINLLYQDMVKKRAEIDRLEKAGKFKYEYDSDEDVEGGTWEHKLRQQEMMATQLWAEELTRQAAGKHHIGDFLPPEELERFMEKYNAVKQGRAPDLSDYKEFKLKEDNVGYRLLQKMGWNEGQGLGQDGTGITNPVNKAATRHENQGLGVDRPDGLQAGDDEYDAYRKRMMLAYRFRPNPLNNPRRPYY